MIIAISGSVGSGKTTIAKDLAKELNYSVIQLNELAKEFKIKEVPELQTFDFDIDKLVAKVNRDIADGKYKNTIFEGHFAHFLNPDLIDFLFVINRDLKELKKEYLKRNYNEQKIKDNLEVESFNLCFYEAEEEGYEILSEEEKSKSSKGKVFAIDNSNRIDDLIEKIKLKLKE